MEKIKVVFVNYQLICGGAEQALFDLICLMDKEKFDVSVFIQNQGGEWEEKFRDAGIKILYDYSCRKATFNPIKKLGNIVKKIRTQKALNNEGEGLLDVCLVDGADIVVSYSAWCKDWIAFKKGAKSVKYIHGDPATNPAYRGEAMQKRHVLEKYDRIICVSDAACRSFKEISGLSEGVEMHFNPLNSDNVRVLAENKVDLPTDVPVICAVGRLSAEKGFERLIYIHRRLLDQGILHKLVLVGDGPDRDFIRRTVQATNTEDSVILAGYQSNPYPYMKQSKFLVSSSFTEGLPVIAMEALCLGIPIVAPVPSVGEAFGAEMCGLITENDNLSLENGIKKMLTDEAFYAQTKAGAEKRSKFFDGKRMVKEIEDMFLELVKE